MSDEPKSIQAAILVIGDEILSGRTKDKNIGFIAETLTDIGVDLTEVRIVADEEDDIVAAVRALSSRYDIVFTTGGIGPTHDDITADAIASAFDVGIDVDPRARAVMEAHYAGSGRTMNEARLRMARIPDGADLIVNKVSGAPGFKLNNVYVMAGVPSIMQSMMDEIVAELPTGKKLISSTIEAGRPEGDVAALLREVDEDFPTVRIGSYPYVEASGRYLTRIVVRSRDKEALQAAQKTIEDRLASQ